MSVGFRIVQEIERVPEETVRKFRSARLATSNVADVMWRFGALDEKLCPIGDASVYLTGTALTVRTRPTDNLMVHKALELAQPGDIIVIEAGGEMRHAILGELMCRYAAEKGVGGFVVDGPVRDGSAIHSLGFPVYARGLTPRGPYKEGPGEINVPVSCGGVAISPGDLILGDADGVVVVPRDSAGEVLEEASAVERSEEEVMKLISTGRWERGWIDEKLKEKGCEIVG